MIKKGDKLKPKDELRIRYNITSEYVTVDSIESNHICVKWIDDHGKEGGYCGVLNVNDDFYIFETLNEDIRKLIDSFEIVDASFTTRDGKNINLYLNN